MAVLTRSVIAGARFSGRQRLTAAHDFYVEEVLQDMRAPENGRTRRRRRQFAGAVLLHETAVQSARDPGGQAGEASPPYGLATANPTEPRRARRSGRPARAGRAEGPQVGRTHQGDPARGTDRDGGQLADGQGVRRRQSVQSKTQLSLGTVRAVRSGVRLNRVPCRRACQR